MFSNVFNTIWSNPENRILEKQIHGETVVLAENEGRLCAAKRVGNEFVSLILSGIPTKVNTALDKALTYAQLKDSNLQLVGPQLTVLPRLRGGAGDPETFTNLDAFRKWLKENSATYCLSSSKGKSYKMEVLEALAGSQISSFKTENAYPITGEYAKALAAVLPYTKISTLYFGYTPIDPEGILALAAVLPFTQVTHLCLTRTGITTEGIRALATALPLSQVVHLELSDCIIDVEAAKALAIMLPHSNIRHLYLGRSMSDATTEILAKKLPQSQVCWLDLSESTDGLGDTAVKALAATLPQSKLLSLDLSKNIQIGNKGVKILAAALSRSKLQKLKLWDCGMTDEGARELADALPQSKLLQLCLGSNQIGNIGVKALATVLPASKLQELALCDCGITDEGTRDLAAALPQSNLLELYLSSNQIGNKGANVLAAVLPQSKLFELELDDAMEPESIDAFTKVLPTLKRLKSLDLIDANTPASPTRNISLDALDDAYLRSQLIWYSRYGAPPSINEAADSRFIALSAAMIKAIGESNIDHVRVLLEENPYNFFLNHSQYTFSLLDLAVRANHPQLVDLLLKYYPDSPWRSFVTCPSPWQLARELGHHDLVELLEAGLPDAIPVPDPVPVPKDYYCSITQEIMYDPVLLAGDGVTYEREAIEKWLQTSDLSPLHGSPLASKLLIPNQFCKGQIRDLIEKHSHLEKETYIPEASKKACLAAIGKRDASGLKDLLKDRRLLSVDFPNGLLIELACQTTPEILQTVIEAYKARPHFNHELCTKAAQGLGAEGVSLLFHLLPKKVPTGLLPALFEAIKLQSGAYLKALLEMGVSPNSRDLRGSYPLHLAVEADSKELITILMENDANLKAVDREGRTPIQLAEKLGELDLVRHIKQKKIEIKLRPLLAPIQEQINAQGRVIQQLRGSLFEAQTSLGNIVPLLGANPSLSSVADELVALRKRIDQHFN